MQNNPAMHALVKQIMDEQIPVPYPYHNYDHAWYVQQNVIEIAAAEKIAEADVRLLSTAAIWHDTGYVHTVEGHEEASCVLAAAYLPDFGFTDEDINSIKGMIMATKLPQSPTGKLEEIIADADLLYLGTNEAAQRANDLFKEMQERNTSFTRAEWNSIQIDFLAQHRYFTAYCKEKFEPVKKAYLAKLRKDLED